MHFADLEMTSDEIAAAAAFFVEHNFQLIGQNMVMAKELGRLKEEISKLQKEAKGTAAQAATNELNKLTANRVDLLYNTIDPDTMFWHNDISDTKTLFEDIIGGLVEPRDMDDENFVQKIKELLASLENMSLVATEKTISKKRST